MWCKRIIHIRCASSSWETHVYNFSIPSYSSELETFNLVVSLVVISSNLTWALAVYVLCSVGIDSEEESSEEHTSEEEGSSEAEDSSGEESESGSSGSGVQESEEETETKVITF